MDKSVAGEVLLAEVGEIISPYITQALPVDLTEEQREALYAFGHDKYMAGLYLEAAHIFCSLMRFDLAEAKYFKAFAGCMLMLDRPQAAVSTYAAAYMLNMDDPVPLFYLAQCFSMLNMPEAMQDMLVELERETQGRPEWDTLRARGRALAAKRESRAVRKEK